MENTTALITVMTSYYNDREFLADVISSVLAQTYTHFEYILVNHASTDKSREIAHSFKDPRIKHIDLPMNYGGSGNILIQKALDQAQGQYLKTICADDILRPNGLEILVKAAQAQNADLLFGNVAFVKKDKTPLHKTWFEHRYAANLPVGRYLRYFLNGTSWFPYAGNFIKIDALRKVPMDYVSIQLADGGLWVSLLLNGAKLAFTQEVVADYRLHKNQMCSSSNFDVIGLRCQFEHFLFYQHFLEAKLSLSLLKEMFPQDPLITQLTDADESYIPFCLAYTLYRLKINAVCTLACRLKLAQLLNDYPLQQRLEKRFGFTVRDLRQDIVQAPILLLPVKYPLTHNAGEKKWQQKMSCPLRKILNFFLMIVWKLKRRREDTNPKENMDGFV